MAFVVKSIKPQKMKLKQIRFEVLNALRKEGAVHVREYKDTVKTWTTKPTFGYLISTAQGDLMVVSGPKDKGEIWGYLDKGTKVRHAVMSKDWKSKTSPGRWRSGRGAGRMVFVSRKIRLPGIKARGWTEDLSKRRKRPFQRNILKAVQRGAKRLY